MKLDRENSGGNFIHGFAGGRILVGSMAFTGPVIVAPDRIIAEWLPEDPEHLTMADLQPGIALEPEVILLGTGARQHFPAPAVSSAVLRLGIGLEVMNTAAACRTFNVLASEMRRVVAMLMVE